MKLSDIGKPGTKIWFGEGDVKAWVSVKGNAGSAFLIKGHVLTQEARTRLGLAESDALPPTEDHLTVLKSRVGTYVDGWGGFEDDNGNEIPFRLPDGTLNEMGGAQILSNPEISETVDKEIAKQQTERLKAIEEAAKNLSGPSPAN